MRLEDQVCTFEQAKILNTLGCKASSHYSYYTADGVNWELIPTSMVTIDPEYDTIAYYAYTAAELGVLLGEHTNDVVFVNGEWSFVIGRSEGTEASERASALIWRIGNGYAKPEDLKL